MSTALATYAFICLMQENLVCLVWPGYVCSISALCVALLADKANGHKCEPYGVTEHGIYAENRQSLQLLAYSRALAQLCSYLPRSAAVCSSLSGLKGLSTWNNAVPGTYSMTSAQALCCIWVAISEPFLPISSEAA